MPTKGVEQEKQQSKLPIGFRLLPLAIGAGLVTSYAPLLKPITGRADYWHGAPINYAPSIGEKGILIDYAGANKRLNSILATNSILEAVGNAIEDLPDDHPAKQKLRELLPEHGGKFSVLEKIRDDLFDYHKSPRKSDPIFRKVRLSIIQEHLQEGLGLGEQEAQQLAQKMLQDTKGHYIDDLVTIANHYFQHHTGKELPQEEIRKQLFERGKRIYLSQSAPSAYTWGFHGNELEIQQKLSAMSHNELIEKAMKELRDEFTPKQIARMSPEELQEHLKRKLLARTGKETVKRTLYTLANTATFGLVDLTRSEVIEPLQYTLKARKAPIKEADLTNPEEFLKVLKEHGIDPRTGADRYSAVFKVTLGKEHIPSLGALKDFKGFEALMGSAPLFRQTLSHIIPNYTPGRDISVAGSIHPHQIKEVHIVDLFSGKPVLRIKNKAYKAPEKALGKGMKTVLKHAPFVALGGYLLYKGLGLDRKLRKESSATSRKYTKHLIRKAIKYAIPAAAVAGTYTTVSNLPRLTYETSSGFMSELSPAEQAKAQARLSGVLLKDPKVFLSQLAAGVALAGGTVGTMYGIFSHNPIITGLSLGAAGGAILGMALPTLTGLNPIQSVVSPHSEKDEKKRRIKQFIVAGATALPVGYAVYAFSRHYPHHMAKIKDAIKEMVERAQILSISPTVKKPQKAKKKFKAALGAGFAIGSLSGVGAFELMAHSQLKEIEKMKKEKGISQ